MDYFGDESGHFRGLLHGDCEVCVIAVVAGARIDCIRCPKKTVRNITDIPEAKWNDLKDHQKRRFFECFAEQDGIEFGYARITQEDLHTMDGYHHIYQNISFPPDWDLALTGYAYGEILFELGARDERRTCFEFDRISSKKQSEEVLEHVQHFVRDLDQAFYKGSRECPGIQAADCLAGGVAEDYKSDTDWLGYLDTDSVTDCKGLSLLQLENRLTDL